MARKKAAWTRALVTGASSGIGMAFAKELAELEADLVLVARSEDKLTELADELAGTHGIEVECIGADLTDPEQRAGVEARLADVDRPIDLLVNNAGFGTTGRFVEQDLAREEGQVELNVTALVRLTHAALGRMRAEGRGAILNVSSVAGFQPVPGNATYAATKAFVTSFTEAVHEESARDGVTVSVLCPGFTRTKFQDTADYDASAIPDFMWMEADRVAQIALDGLRDRRAVIIPGALNRAMSAPAKVMPSAFARKVMKQLQRLSS